MQGDLEGRKKILDFWWYCVQNINVCCEGIEVNDKETIVKILSIVDKNPEYSQRDISSALGVSLGKVNYVLRALLDKGLIKTERFINSKNKWAYRYILTPKGMKEKLKLTQSFVRQKMREYESLLD